MESQTGCLLSSHLLQYKRDIDGQPNDYLAVISVRDIVCNELELLVTSIYVGIDRQDTSIHNTGLSQHPSAYVSIRQHTTAYVRDVLRCVGMRD